VRTSGRVIDEQGAPQAGLSAEAWSFHVLFGLRREAFAITGADGRFAIDISLTTDLTRGIVLTNLHVRIRTNIGRILFLSDFRLLSLITQDWSLADVTIPQTTLRGWRITNLDPTGKQHLYSEANFDRHRTRRRHATSVHSPERVLNRGARPAPGTRVFPSSSPLSRHVWSSKTGDAR
jgi:hypothetical protein